MEKLKNSWYEDRSGVKWYIVLISLLIIAGSVIFTDYFVRELKERERNQVTLYTKALGYIANSADEEILFITDEIITKNTSIPIILMDEKNNISSYSNITIPDGASPETRQRILQHELKKMKAAYPPIEIVIRDPKTHEVFGKNYVYYRNSHILNLLIVFPYIQLSIVLILGVIAYLAFNYSRLAEQNRVWIGLTKETAHQLGTPISSLMAWLEILKEMPELKSKQIITELEKDIDKLKLVTDRFSSIGSQPVLKNENVVDITHRVADYMRSRISSRIVIDEYAIKPEIFAQIHAPLYEWVIENLLKNAVDAIQHSGTIAIKIIKANNNRVFIDVSDTGKGMNLATVKNVFNPGFTTKRRGWGLGLTLAKRIIENYHHGKIFVSSSAENQGTTFRIELNGG